MRYYKLLAMFGGLTMLASCTDSRIIGKYQGDGQTAEFLQDGTLLFVAGSQTGLWTWKEIDGDRLALVQTGVGVIGPQVCGFTFRNQDQELRLTNCRIPEVWKRLP